MIQQYSLNVQAELHEGWLLEIGYVGTRGTHLVRQRSLNQALPASTNNPIRGVTENTFANIPLRVPILGVPPDSLLEMESEGSSWYNGLEASLTKRLSHGLQFLASYTFSKTLDTDGSDINSTSSGNALTLGDQNSPRQRWGRASFDRTHRFVFSTTWTLPSPPRGVPRAVLGDWSLAAIATIQSGSALTIAETNSTNVFGISEDRAQLSGTCSKSQLVKGGAVESKLSGYFNASCFTSSANHRRGWHRNGVWEQRDRDRKRSRTSKPGSRFFKNGGAQLARREKQSSISCRILQCTEPSPVCQPRHRISHRPRSASSVARL